MSTRALRTLAGFCVSLAISSLADAASPGPVRGHGGAVASSEAAATEVGLGILRAGGNAVDAAVATALALAVVHPQAGNLGGGGFAVVRIGGATYTLDFRETAPATATATMYLDENGDKIRGSSWVGPLATGTPGSPQGLWELQRRFGILAWPAVVAPAIELATGFVVSNRLGERLSSSREYLERFGETARVWLPGGKVPVAGSRMALPDLENTLRLYSDRGPTAITEGPIATAIEDAVRAHGGVLTARDLAEYRAVWRQPVVFEAYGWSLASMDLPSSGGMILGQGLKLLERLGFEQHPSFGAERAHLLTEVWRRSFADRFLLGDPASGQATVKDLLDEAWISERAGDIDVTTATTSGEVFPWAGPPPHESTETTHLSVIDAAGSLVALTTTLNGGFGCGLLVPGAGFLLNNEMDDFTTATGRKNHFGIVQGEANQVRPGRRMLSSIAPTLAWRDTEALILGASGGPRIPTATMQTLLAVTLDHLDIQRAVNQPRIHHQWLPDLLRWEEGALSPETIAELTRRGHAVSDKAATNGLARVHAIHRLRSGEIQAAADPRGPGVAGVVKPLPD